MSGAVADPAVLSALVDRLPMTACSDEASWLAQRDFGIGASEAACVLGENPYKSALQLYCEKAGITAPADLSANEAVEWGHRLEGVIAEKYEAETGRKVVNLGRFTILHHPDLQWQSATLDRAIEPCGGHDGPGVLEIKTSGAHHEEEWETGVPRAYWVQVQHQLAVTGFSWGSIAVLLGGQKFRWMDIERDEAFIASLTEAEAAFWHCVHIEAPPDPDGTESARQALARMYPTETGASVALDGEASDWDEELVALKDRIKSLESRKCELENLLKAAIGDATTGVLPNGVAYTFKSQTRAEHIVKESTFRVLRRAAAKK